MSKTNFEVYKEHLKLLHGDDEILPVISQFL